MLLWKWRVRKLVVGGRRVRDCNAIAPAMTLVGEHGVQDAVMTWRVGMDFGRGQDVSGWA